MSEKNEIIDSAAAGEYDLEDLVGDDEGNCEQPTEDGDYKKDSCAPFLNEAINRLEEENEKLRTELQGCKNVLRGLRMVLADKKVEIARTEDVLMTMCIITILSGLMAFRAYLW